MALMDEFKEERERLKHGSLKDKLKHFWYYYKFHTIVTLICLIALAVFIHDAVTKKEYVFNAAFVNTSAHGEVHEFTALTAKALGIDTDKYTLSLDNSIFIDSENPDSEATFYSVQKLSVLMMTYDLDVTIMTEDTHRSYSYNMAFGDLREILSAEQLKKYEPYFYYMDYSLYEDIAKFQSKGESYAGEFPNPLKPENMKEPIPVGIYLNDAELLHRYYLPEKNSVFGIPAGGEHLEAALKFLDFVFSETES